MRCEELSSQADIGKVATDRRCPFVADKAMARQLVNRPTNWLIDTQLLIPPNMSHQRRLVPISPVVQIERRNGPQPALGRR